MNLGAAVAVSGAEVRKRPCSLGSEPFRRTVLTFQADTLTTRTTVCGPCLYVGFSHAYLECKPVFVIHLENVHFNLTEHSTHASTHDMPCWRHACQRSSRPADDRTLGVVSYAKGEISQIVKSVLYPFCLISAIHSCRGRFVFCFVAVCFCSALLLSLFYSVAATC